MLLSERSPSEMAAHGVSNYRMFWKRQNCGPGEQISGARGWGRKGGTGGAQRMFRAVKTLCMTP